MTNTENYSFEVSLSTKAFDHKPDRDTEVPRLVFKRTETNVYDFIESIIDGYCYAGIFSTDSFDMKGRKKYNYSYTYLLSIDVDHSTDTMDDFVDSLIYKPTFAYTSCNDGVDGERRYRLVYCFDEKIEGKEEYYNYINAIMQANGLDINEKIGEHYKYDHGSLEAYRYYNGNGTETIDINIQDNVYNKEDFSFTYKDYYNSIYKENDRKVVNNDKSVNQNHIHTHTNNMCLNDTLQTQFIDDFWNMRMGDVIAKYVEVYPNLEHTPLDTPDEDTPLIVFPEGYTEIRRWWRVNRDGQPIKIKDGEGRRRKLFLNGILRRLINPDITFDNLLYNLLFELYNYYSNYNAKNNIGKTEIYQIANDVMKTDIAKYERLRGTKRKFTVNKEYCAKHHLNKRQVINKVGKQKREKEIGKLYDYQLDDKKNLEVMKENGLEISLSTLKRWRKANGIKRYKKESGNL